MGEIGIFRYDIYATGMRVTLKAHRATSRLVATLLDGISLTGSEGCTRNAYWITGLDKLTAVQRCTFESGIRGHYNNPANLMPDVRKARFGKFGTTEKEEQTVIVVPQLTMVSGAAETRRAQPDS